MVSNFHGYQKKIPFFRMENLWFVTSIYGKFVIYQYTTSISLTCEFMAQDIHNKNKN